MSEMTATRMTRGATYLAVAGGGAWLASLLWRTSVPHLVTSRLDAETVFGAALLRRTASYVRFLRVDWVVLVLVQLAVLLSVVRRSRRLRLGLGPAGAGLVLAAVAEFARTGLQQPDPPAWDFVFLEDHPTLLQRVEQALSSRRASPAGS
jgi:hypothetical protein